MPIDVPSSRAAWVDAEPLHCTIAAATGSATRSGEPLLLSNSDDPFTTRTRLVVEQPPDGWRFIATQIVSPPPPVSFNLMHTRGLNEAGLAYTWAMVRPATEPADDVAIGIPYYQFGRLVLATARTVGEALDLIDRYPRAYHGNFLFADATGEIALVEISTRSCHVETRTRDGAIARANHWVSDVMAPRGAPEPALSTRHRRQRMAELVEAHRGAIDGATFARFAADHAGRDEIGYSICAHGRAGEPGGRWGGSVSSEIAEPVARRFWYCYGWPCGEAPDHPTHQTGQDRSWGHYLPFHLADLAPGEYVTTDGRLTPLAVGYLARLTTPRPLAAATS